MMTLMRKMKATKTSKISTRILKLKKRKKTKKMKMMAMKMTTIATKKMRSNLLRPRQRKFLQSSLSKQLKTTMTMTIAMMMTTN